MTQNIQVSEVPMGLSLTACFPLAHPETGAAGEGANGAGGLHVCSTSVRGSGRNAMRGTRVPMLGRRFGLLVVQEALGATKMGLSPRFRCACDCGNDNVVATGNYLRNGGKTSCGCTRQRTYQVQQDYRARAAGQGVPA